MISCPQRSPTEPVAHSAHAPQHGIQISLRRLKPRCNSSLDRCRNIEVFDSEPKAWFYQEAETDRNTFAVISLWGKFGGLCACAATFPHIVPLPNIFLTRLFSKTRLKRKDFQEIVRLTWAQEVPSSNLGAPTKNISRVFSYLLKAPFTSNPICGILADRRSGFASRLVCRSSPHDEYSKTRPDCGRDLADVGRTVFGRGQEMKNGAVVPHIVSIWREPNLGDIAD